jgi:glutamate-ammonia-ligase adenylyltransferase
LRKLRRDVMLRLIVRDLNGLADLAEVVETCTLLAEVAINTAAGKLDGWQQARYGMPLGESGTPQQLIVIGMGKLGGRELNVSSDIDLIFAYAEDGETNGAEPISNQEYFTRLAKKLIAAIDEITADGFVFRVDMMLRPNGSEGALVSSFAALEGYYQSHGREWERYAWIKGRAICGDANDIAALQQLLRPFVFRKYLDFGAFASMRDLKQQIKREVARRDMYNNIKLGPGGIREIEFIAQVFQLIRGGQQRELQIRATLQVLSLLAAKGLMPLAAVTELQAAYVFLRNLEHRLQYLQDAQTQKLPEDEESCSRIAKGMGYANWTDFLDALHTQRKRVEQYFNAVFEDQAIQGAHTNSVLWTNIADTAVEGELTRQLEAMGFVPADQALNALRSMNRSSKYQLLSPASRQRFDALIPRLIEAAAVCSHATLTLCRALDLLEVIGRRANYLALLTEYPQALGMVCRLCDASPWLGQYLAQHPVLLDELLDTRVLYAAPDFPALGAELEQRLLACGEDVEAKLDTLRHFKHAQHFRLAAQDVAGGLALETLSDYLSALADIVLDAVLRHAWAGLKGRHRELPKFAVIGYGKLGGKELGYASDLDIIFLYDDDAAEAGDIYARFGQRINHWLGSLTSAGMLYETDLRLRPDGASGLLVSEVSAFEEYQQHKAWTWEHQAITRARFCAGDAAIGAQFERIRHDIVCRPRDVERLRSEVVAMRQKMLDGHPNNSHLFDIKHDRGGIVDVEFMVQMLVLAYASQHALLAENVGNIALLHRAGSLGLIPEALAQSVADAYRVFRQHQHRLRLQGETRSRLEHNLLEPQIRSVRALWALLMHQG